jgi:dipeptidyl aminopeptidase/acylaminoacyl peptidase
MIVMPVMVPCRRRPAISTPMFIVYGGLDYRVPVGEAHRLWWDLMSRAREDSPNPHKFLYFPQGKRFVNTPSDLALWYATVLAFFGAHLRGEAWRRPELLG